MILIQLEEITHPWAIVFVDRNHTRNRMSDHKTTASNSQDIPPAPDICDECDNTGFTPRSLPKDPESSDEKEFAFAYHECSDCGARYNDRSNDFPNDVDLRVPTWKEIFGHPSPYEHQEKAIKDIVKTSLSRGYTVMEGACGTGKTMIALTSGLRLVKDPRTKFKRILVLTSVKQQLRQFEDDLRVINQNLPDDVNPARGVTLVGKTDLCPYSREDEGELTKDNVTMRCRQLRDQTSQLMADGKNGIALSNQASGGSIDWETAGADIEYDSNIPSDGKQYCPFYAKYKEEGDPLFSFGHASDCILDPEEIVRQAVNKGVCPHSAMTVLCRDADVVIANYYHAFDQNTLQITHHLIDDETLVVCDEAHMLEPRVRGILSTTAPAYAFQHAAHEVAAVSECLGEPLEDDLRVSVPDSAVAHETLGKSGIHPDVLPEFHEVLCKLHRKVTSVVETQLSNDYPGWESDPSILPGHEELPLRDPKVHAEDTISSWAAEQDISDGIWNGFPQLSVAISDILTEGTRSEGSSHSITDVAELMSEWFERDHTRYFREITLSENTDPHPSTDGWERHLQAEVELHNVMPRAVIGSRLEEFGAGLLMSATLEPMDVYQEVTGLSYLSTGKGKLVEERQYGASFPEENRFSVTVPLDKYTSSNRGDVTEATDTRRQYAKVILTVAQTTPGNVLVCMPSYKEAKWAGSFLSQSDNVEKEVFVDESSSEQVTRELKQSFFSGDPKVLVTSLRGTLTEGVDFDGEKLLGCVVCGLPIDNIGSPQVQAVRSAYEDEFGQIGFDYGLRVPAVRKTRQALGRVIRGDNDVGVRVLVDERYADAGGGGVRRYLSDKERDEYTITDDLSVFQDQLSSFWEQHSSHSFVE